MVSLDVGGFRIRPEGGKLSRLKIPLKWEVQDGKMERSRAAG